MLISIIGSPSSGKSTLATSVQYELKRGGFNSIIAPEAATDFIAEFGIPDSPMDQMIIFYNQLNREKMYIDSKEYIICDSSSLLNYFYFRSLFPKKLSNKDISAINHIQKEILKSINQWDYIFYLPPMDVNSTEDGIRFHNKEEIKKIDNQIRSYLDMENVEYIDLSKITLNDRCDYIKNVITKKTN